MVVPRIAIYFPELTKAHTASIGGAAFRILHAIDLLKHDCDVTLVTESRPDWKRLNRVYGTSLPEDCVNLLLPRRRFGIRDDKVFLLPYCGQHFDLCISGHNINDFRARALYFLANCRFDSRIAKVAGAVGDASYELYDDRPSGMLRRLRWITKKNAKHVLSLIYAGKPRSVEAIIRSPGERFVCNSHWMAKAMLDCYGMEIPDVLYPPVAAEFPNKAWSDRHMEFLCVGRIAPEKKVEQAIEIVEKVRNTGFPSIKLHIAGRIPKTQYGRKIQLLVDSRSWIVAHGEVYGQVKQELMTACRFAIHACAIEAFGISIAEYMKAGVIPFVPDRGAAGELVPLPELQFGTADEAVAKIIALLNNPAHQLSLHDKLIERGRIFTLDKFRVGFRRIVDEELAKRRGLCDSAKPVGTPNTDRQRKVTKW